jgi:hypothetical protein
MKKMDGMAFAVALAVSLPACASIASHAPKWSAATQEVEFVSEPADASIWLDGKLVGATPTRIAVPTGRVVTVRLEKDGYAATDVPLHRTLSGWLAGDAAFLLYAFAPNGFGDRPESRATKAAVAAGIAATAFVVDLSNGAAFRLPARVSVTLVRRP